MLLKLRIRNFAADRLKVDTLAIAAFQARCRPASHDIAAYLMDSNNLLDAESVQQALLPAPGRMFSSPMVPSIESRYCNWR